MKEIVIYGVLGAEQQYRVGAYWCLRENDISIANIMYEADTMRLNNPSIESIYAIDNCYGLKREYIESVKQNSIESCYCFKDILEREGLRIF